MGLDRKLLALAARDLRRPLAAVSVVGLGVVACWVTQALLVVHCLAAVIEGEPVRSLWPLLGALLGVVVLRAALVWWREVLASWAGHTVKARLRSRLVGHLLRLGPAYTTGARTGTVQSVLVDGVEGLDGYYSRYLPQLVVATVGATGIVLYLATVSAPVAGVLAVSIVLLLVAPRLWDATLTVRAAEHWQAYRDLKSDYLDGMQGMTTLKALGAAGRYHRSLHDRAWALFRSTMRQLAASLVGTGLTALIIGLGTAAAVAVGAFELTRDRLDLVALLTVLLLTAECFRPFADLAHYWHLSYVGFSAAAGIDELLRTEGVPRPPAAAGGGTAVDGEATLELEEVSFGYPGSDRLVLDRCTVRLAPGEAVALIGPSGVGKSTVLALALRFFDPGSGIVRLGGRDLRDWDDAALRRTVAVVPQDPYVFHGTVAANIRLGRPEATDAQVRAAAEAANAAEFIDRLPGGYGATVDERGLTLSGGQRQRLAIARALLLDAPVLLLDEATSNLDPESEALVHDALDRLMRGRTTLLVTHRLSTGSRMDRIIVLDGGRVVESGSHDELLSRGGDYSRLLALQGGAA